MYVSHHIPLIRTQARYSKKYPGCGLQFIHQEANYRGVYRVIAVDDCAHGWLTTGDKLVVGQLAHLSVGEVLQHLKDIKSLSRDIDDDFIRLYQSIYRPSWMPLSDKRELSRIVSTKSA